MSRSRLLVIAALCALAGASAGDDKKDEPKSPAPPKGFDKPRDTGARGKVEASEYESESAGAKRKAQARTPPDFDNTAKYPVLYLLHGIGGDVKEWTRGGAAKIVLDNLRADKKLVPMIVVLPLEAKKVPPERHVHAGGGHDFAAWKADLYHFAPLLFR